MRLTKTRLSNPLKTAVHRNTNEKTGLNQILKTKVDCLLILPSNKRTQVRTRAKFGEHDTLPSRTTFDSMGRQLRQILPMIIKFTKRKEKGTGKSHRHREIFRFQASTFHRKKVLMKEDTNC